MSEKQYGIDALQPADSGVMYIIAEAASEGFLRRDAELQQAVQQNDLAGAINALERASKAARCLSPLDPHPAARPAREAREVLKRCNTLLFGWMLSS